MHLAHTSPPRGSPPDRATLAAWVVLGLGVLAYATAVLNRASLGVAALEAQDRLHASTTQLALLAVMQLAVYAVSQVPVGILLDRFGPRAVIGCGLLLMALGQGALALASTVPAGIGARVLVGAGDAMTFISVVRVAANWFPPSQLPVITQATAIVGQCGQLAASYPLIALLAGVGWATTFAAAAGLTFLLFVLVVLLLRGAPPGSGASTPPAVPLRWRGAWAAVRSTWARPAVRLGFWCHFTVQFAGMVFVLMWGYPFLVESSGTSPRTAGALLAAMVPVGILVGAALGRCSSRWPRHRLAMVVVPVALTVAAWASTLSWPGPTPTWLLALLVVALATNVPASMVGLDIAREGAPARHVGIATGIGNSGGSVASLLAILLIGAALDLADTAGVGTEHRFVVAMATQVLVWCLGAAMVLRARRALRSRAYGRARDRRPPTSAGETRPQPG